ncbi:dihydrofolate reductase family protein [Actinomycetospora sp. OC33-EN08]|uniref:Dihydrofolate reductase family protein n=1 Tax=Actinomycetospora aurantiaca TaxID=3129233 RepID=A0ABU8MX99_9PSEU
MGRIHIETFCSLDLVGQAPGGPDEDPSGGFAFGGWQAPLLDDVVGEQIARGMEGVDALLLGRRTYDIFAAFWPHYSGEEDREVAELFDRVPKYVVSRGAPQLDWANSTLVRPEELPALRDRHDKIYVSGSLDLVRTLLVEDLYDRLTLFVHPLLLGTGKRVVENGALPSGLRLAEPAVTSPSGVVVLRYEPTGAPPERGDMTVR